eukprot:8034851-Lingulodinium_polyedra.AAC.1
MATVEQHGHACAHVSGPQPHHTWVATRPLVEHLITHSQGQCMGMEMLGECKGELGKHMCMSEHSCGSAWVWKMSANYTKSILQEN